jgi:hypothetical protein
VVKRRTYSAHAARRVPLGLALSFACLATCLVPGDAVAYRGGGPRVPVDTHGGSGPASAAQASLLRSDMSNPSQEMPAGVPSWYDWAEHPRVHQISGLMRTFHAFTAWGQLYQCAGVHPTPRAAVELRDLQAWVLLRRAPRWRRIQFSSDLSGAAFADDYNGPTVAGRYSHSSTATVAQLVSGHNFHFWPNAGRVSLDDSEVTAVTVAVQARLASTPDSSPTPCLVLSVGGDMWRSSTVPAGGSSSGDVGIGRFKRVEPRWRLFTMTTASPSLLVGEPLPPLAPAADDF